MNIVAGESRETSHETIGKMRLIESIAPETPWDDLKTGVPALFYGWRGVGGSSTPLSDRWKAKFGRDYLLGDGIYFAPTKQMAKKFGDPVQCKVVLNNPFVIPNTTGTELLRLDLEDIKKTHDGIVILSGRASGNEDLRQAIVFPKYSKQAELNIAPPKLSTLQPGAKVKITNNFTNVFAEKQYGHLSGKVGTVTSITMGHPNVRIGGKSYFMSKQDVEIV